MLYAGSQWDFSGIESKKFFGRITIKHAHNAAINYICEDFKTDPVIKKITHLTGSKFEVGNGFIIIYREGFEPIKLQKS